MNTITKTRIFKNIKAMQNELNNLKHSLTKKLLVYFFIICTFVGVTVSTHTYFTNKKYMLNMYFNFAHACAIDISNMLYDFPVNDFIAGKNKDLYDKNLKSIKNIATSFSLKQVYVYVPNVKDRSLTLVYIVDKKLEQKFEKYKLGYVSNKYVVQQDVIELFKNKKRNLSKEQNDKLGHVVSSYSTIIDKNQNSIAVVRVDIDFSEVESKIKHDIRIVFIRIIGGLSFIFFLCIFFIKKHFITPIKKISSTMLKSFKNRQLNNNFAEINSEDELNVISDLYNIIEMENKRIESELSIAKTIQHASLPNGLNPYPQRKEFNIYADMDTAKEVGGDFYDYFFVNDNEFVMMVADVSGKGIPAALFMMAIKNTINTILKSGTHIEEAMNILNKKLCEKNEEEFFATMFLVKINLVTGAMEYVNVGHNPPLIKRSNGYFEYYRTEPNFVIGLMEDYKYTCGKDKLNAGDEIFLYTDGITEATNKVKELYGEDRLLKILNKDKNIELEKIIPSVKEDISRFIQNEPQSDDITTVAFKYNGKI